MKLFLLSTFVLFLFVLNSFAQTYPSGFSQVLIAQGITNPTVMDFAPDGRIFVAQQDGALRVIKNGTLLSTPAIDLNVDAAAERGLIGITLHPEFALNKWVYLYYTLPASPARNRISRFTFNGDIINPSSEVTILDLDPLDISPIHNGGCMKFGQDGKLYVTIGDNNRSDDAQNPDTYWGKMIRINADGSVPADNPFVSASTPQKKRLWAMGLRNPFTFDIQPGTGKIFVNEVGHALWEEIQDATSPGLNFGWPLEQGNNPSHQFTNPFYAYGHGDGSQVGCAISGGCFFNPSSTNYPSQYIGKYFFMDYCEGWIGFINPQSTNASHTVFASAIPSTALTIKVGNDGNLYFLGRDKGSVYKIIYSLNAAPAITDQPDNLMVARTQSASFNVSVSGVPPFSYVWKKNGTAIPNSNAAVFTINNVQPTDSGKYSVTVSNASGTVTSTAATLSVSTSYPPQATIITPSTGSTYEAGDTLLFSGSGTDPEDGTLPGSAFTWEIEFHHGSGSNYHLHDGPPIATGAKTGRYIIPKNNETSDEVFYRLILNVKDKNGFAATKFVDILPEKSTITLTTDPPNLRVYLDGIPRSTPFSSVSVEGIERSLGIISPQMINGVPYVFDKWSHGSAASNVIRAPENDVTYTATFKKESSLRAPENPAGATAGLNYQYYQGRFYVVPDFSTLTPVASGVVPTFSLSPRKQEDNFSFKFSGYVDVPTDGEYTFYCQSNDGSKLHIGDRLVINNDGEHNTKELSGVIGLKAGKHAISVGYIETAGTNVLVVSFAGPGIPKQEIPAARLFHITGVANSNPVIYLTSPTANQNFGPAPATILIKANASDADGTISKVEFYNGNTKIGEDLNAPYEFLWASVASGNYSLSAKAFDNQNASAVSSSVSISVGTSTPTNCTASGSITREFWSNITGSTITSIPLSSSPTGSGILNIFEGPINTGDNYGTRIRGYICAPQTGDYYFWIASNDNAELWLSKDENPSTKTKIAYVSSFTASREWAKLSTQKSAAIRLEAGKKYYIEALHKEGVNSDHISVGWQLPDGTLERPIPGSRLSPFGSSTSNSAPSVSIVSPSNNQQFGNHARVLIQAQASDNDGNVTKVEFYQNSIKLAEDLIAPFEYTWDHPTEGNYTITAKAYDDKNASSTSTPVSIKVQYVSDGCAAEGKILREFWNAVSGDKVVSIPTQLTPSGSEFLTLFEGPQNSAHNYGTRISGYICPPQTGMYYFWISSNDNGELWLSSNDNPANKIKIATVPTFSNYREWTKFASQKSAGITLSAGQKYYIEALHKEGYNSDHISVGWQLPDGTLERPIDGSRLSPPSMSAHREAVTPDEYVLAPEIEKDSVYSISAFPNPTEKGMITLCIVGYTGKTKAVIQIYDLEGKKKYTDNINCDVTCPRTLVNIDERFPSGTYVIYVTIDGKVFTQRLIVK